MRDPPETWQDTLPCEPMKIVEKSMKIVFKLPLEGVLGVSGSQVSPKSQKKFHDVNVGYAYLGGKLGQKSTKNQENE